MRRRFFVDSFQGKSATLEGETAHHLVRVLRAKPGQLYELSDGRALWLARTGSVEKNAVHFDLLEQLPAKQARLRSKLLLSIVKFDRFEWALEKATELGVSEVVPLAAARSEKHLLAAASKRAQRWTKILLESSQQSRRLAPPLLRPAVPPAQAFQTAREENVLRLSLSERPDAPGLRQLLDGKHSDSVALAIGPEGGWTEDELRAAQDAGFFEVSLGDRILRTETAVAAALAILNYALGD